MPGSTASQSRRDLRDESRAGLGACGLDDLHARRHEVIDDLRRQLGVEERLEEVEQHLALLVVDDSVRDHDEHAEVDDGGRVVAAPLECGAELIDGGGDDVSHPGGLSSKGAAG